MGLRETRRGTCRGNSKTRDLEVDLFNSLELGTEVEELVDLSVVPKLENHKDLTPGPTLDGRVHGGTGSPDGGGGSGRQ